MGRVSTQEDYLRRERVKQIWASGVRSIYKIAQETGKDYRTIKRDLVVLRREAYNRKRSEKRLEAIRLEEDLGLLQEIEQINNLIKKILSGQEKKTEVVVKDDKPVEKKQEVLDTDYHAINSLIRTKLQARKQRAELWGLVDQKSIFSNQIWMGTNNNGRLIGEDAKFSGTMRDYLRQSLTGKDNGNSI